MKTILYTQGSHDDFYIIAVLQVPDDMTQKDFNELYAHFSKTYYSQEIKKTWNLSREDWDKNYKYMQDQDDELNKRGYEGYDKSSIFASWLCKNYDCIQLDYEEW